MEDTQMASENSRLWMVAAAVGAVLAIPILGSKVGGPATTVTNVISGTEPVDISKTQAAQKRLEIGRASCRERVCYPV